MKSLIIGYEDAAGKGASQLVCGPEVSGGDQARLFHDAKTLLRFPGKFKHLVMIPFEDESRVVHLGDEAAKQLQERHASKQKEAAAAAAAAAKREKFIADLREAQEAFNDSKNRLVSLNARKTSIDHRLSDAAANYAATREDRYAVNKDAAQKELERVNKELFDANKEHEAAEKTLTKLTQQIEPKPIKP